MHGLIDGSVSVLANDPVLLLFLVLGLGYFAGNLRIAGFSCGPVAGVLLAGIVIGHFGLRLSPAAQSFGFALFIFSVGYQAGPRFFSALREDGLRYFCLSLVVTVVAVALVVTLSRLLHLVPGAAAGLLAGGLTSSPTLAAAQNAVREGTVPLPVGVESAQMLDSIATAYAITYIFGLIGLITLIRYMPKLLGVDLVAESQKLEQAGVADVPATLITARSYRVVNPAFTAWTLAELRERYCQRAPVLQVIREGEVVSLSPDERLAIGDIVELVGPRRLFTSGIHEIGPEIYPQTDVERYRDTAQVVVTKRELLGRELAELRIPQTFGLLVLEIIRMGVRIPYAETLTIQKGDILKVVGPVDRIDLLGEFAGVVERDIAETDMVTFSFGIAAGVVLGMLSVHLGVIDLGLGSAGGLLAAGLAVGYLHSIRPTFGRLPEPARWLLMELGLLLFMAGVGLRAGGSIIETLQVSGPLLIVAGVLVTVIPLAVAYLVGRYLLKLNPALLMGALTGAMTSGAALSVVTREAKSSVPAIGYAGTYAFGNILLMVAGPVVLLLA